MFKLALREMGLNAFWGPESFREYAERSGSSFIGKAPEKISVDHIDRLDKSLRDASCMVLRLGASAAGRGTQFALVRPDIGLQEFFLIDAEIFQEAAKREFVPTVSPTVLYPFQLLNAYSKPPWTI